MCVATALLLYPVTVYMGNVQPRICLMRPHKPCTHSPPAFCLCLLQRRCPPQALRELQAIQHNPDVELAAAAAMLVIHESSRVVDQEAVVSLSAKLEVEERSAAGAAALHLANFYTHRHSFERARGLLERALRMPAEPGLQQRLAAALGWCIVQQQQHQQEVDGEPMDGGELAAAAGHFKAALQLDSGDLEVRGCAPAFPPAAMCLPQQQQQQLDGLFVTHSSPRPAGSWDLHTEQL